MARMTVVVTNYGFKKPPVLSEAEYESYKQIFQMESTYNMAPKVSFWDEFVFEKWCLIAIVGGTLLALIVDPLAIIPAIAFVLLLSSMIGGRAQSMFNYQSFLNEKNRYYEGLKSAIITSINYDEFRKKVSRL
jgi:hypothetical protein